MEIGSGAASGVRRHLVGLAMCLDLIVAPVCGGVKMECLSAKCCLGSLGLGGLTCLMEDRNKNMNAIPISDAFYDQEMQELMNICVSEI